MTYRSRAQAHRHIWIWLDSRGRYDIYECKTCRVRKTRDDEGN